MLQQACRVVSAGHLLLGVYLGQELLDGLLIGARLDEALLGGMPVAAISFSSLYRLHPQQAFDPLNRHVGSFHCQGLIFRFHLR